MAPAMTVDWKHVLLDHTVFLANGTYRVARVRRGIDAFPVMQFDRYESDRRLWRPTLSGEAPEHYDYEGKRYNLGFWSVRGVVNGALVVGAILDTNEDVVTYPDGEVRVEATAIYYWDFGDGPGRHAVYLDAFDDTEQRFMADDFVDVSPDKEGTLTAEANNGRLGTDVLERVVIRSRTPLVTRRVLYDFDRWTNEQDLSRADPTTVPVIDNGNLFVKQRDVMAALAHYTHPPADPITLDRIPEMVSGRIIGSLADGRSFVIRVGGRPQPIPLWGYRLANLIAAFTGVGRLKADVNQLRERIEALEKLR